MSSRSFCAAASEAAGEDPAGTASTVRGFLLIEHGGPWGQSALRDATFPDGVAAGLRARCADVGVRPMLMRRHGNRAGLPHRPYVLLAACDSTGGRAAGTHLDDPEELLDLPLADLVARLRAGNGLPPAWSEVRSFFGACTHGRHDACCAERGRPVAHALQEVAGGAAWEVSHMGGDRFAGNVLALPDGIYYGRVTPAAAPRLVAAHAAGRLVPELMRGRSSLPFPVQAAEVALRRHVGADDARGVRPVGWGRRGSRTTSTWEVGGRTWRVVVDTSHPGPPRSLTCSAAPGSPPVHTVVEVTDVAAPGRGAQGWDEAYAGAEVEPEPSAVVVDAVSQLPPGRALDLAAGTGRHALWLSRRGWDVTALDFSAVGVAAGAAATRTAGEAVDWRLGDARVWSPGGQEPGYDLVLMAYVQLPDAARRAHQWLAPGGRLVVVGHAARTEQAGAEQAGAEQAGAEQAGAPRDRRLLHTPETLRSLAEGLVVERLDEVVEEAPRGRRLTALLVARRP